jgi:uncharacterized protein (DUF1800 family)
VFNAAQHDNGSKTFQGQTGNYNADDILAILVRNPATARFISEKLFSFFVYDSPDSSTIDRLANTLVSNNFDVRSLLREIFTGPEFLSAPAFHGQIKQPVDYVLGSLKALNVQNVGPDATQVLRRMGQDLLNPPDVSGWKGGAAWINSTTLFERFNWGNRLSTGRDATKPYFADVPGQIQAHAINSPDGLVDYYLALFVDGDVMPEARQALLDYVNAPSGLTLGDSGAVDLKARGLVHLALATPTYQLA